MLVNLMEKRMAMLTVLVSLMETMRVSWREWAPDLARMKAAETEWALLMEQLSLQWVQK